MFLSLPSDQVPIKMLYGPYFSVIVLSLAGSLVFSAPSCRTLDGYEIKHTTCDGFTSPNDFERYLQRDLLQQESCLVLKDSILSNLPVGVFNGLNISVLEFRNVTLNTFSDPVSMSNPFLALQGSLRELVFVNQSSYPESWSLLQSLRKLQTLKIYATSQLNLTRDFSSLPTSLREIHIAGASIGAVDDDWISGLRNLEVLRLQETTVGKITRSMLPMPAPKLRILDLP